MEERYLFKAKRIDNEEWVIGNLIASPTGDYEISNKCNNPPDCDPMWDKVVITHKVDPTTICQCTGLKDKNGKLIWENDIVKRNFYLYSSEAKYEEKENCGIVKYDKEYARFGYQCSVFAMLSESKKHDTIEVIGNIFDNKELLESEEKQ